MEYKGNGLCLGLNKKEFVSIHVRRKDKPEINDCLKLCKDNHCKGFTIGNENSEKLKNTCYLHGVNLNKDNFIISDYLKGKLEIDTEKRKEMLKENIFSSLSTYKKFKFTDISSEITNLVNAPIKEYDITSLMVKV